jgi:hypothetical protein
MTFSRHFKKPCRFRKFLIFVFHPITVYQLFVQIFKVYDVKCIMYIYMDILVAGKAVIVALCIRWTYSLFTARIDI